MMQTNQRSISLLSSPQQVQPMQVYNVTTIDDDTKLLLSGATSSMKAAHQ